MSRTFAAILLVFVLADAAQAQIAGDRPDSGIGAAVQNSRSPALLGISQDRQRTIYLRNEDLPSSRGTAPQKKSGDPWKGVRSSGPVVDRHKVE